jgi:hypothetical protein
MGTLSVRENFMFSANLRLPKKIGHKEKLQRVEDTIRELGLVKCADSKVKMSMSHCTVCRYSFDCCIESISNNSHSPKK